MAGDSIIEAQKKLVAAGRRRYLLDVDRTRLRKEIGVDNLAQARALLHELNEALARAEKDKRVLLRKIEERLVEDD
jgi:hypothetical protein